jgi:hypothetical protein
MGECDWDGENETRKEEKKRKKGIRYDLLVRH